MSSVNLHALRLGISRPSLEWLKSNPVSTPGFIELGLSELQLEGARGIASWSRWLRQNPDCKAVLQVRITGGKGRNIDRVREQQLALLGELGAEWRGCKVLLSGATQEPERAHEWTESLEGLGYSLGWEHSKTGEESAPLGTTFEVWDPFFHFSDSSENPGFFPSISNIPRSHPGGIRYWKIHGWLEERWMRIYSREQILALRNCAGSSLGHPCETWISLAHSQREEQWADFVDGLRS